MPLSNDQLKEILQTTPIAGMDYSDGLARFGGQVTIYIRIIKTFVANTPNTLEELGQMTSDEIEAYTVMVHGLKGSCYGISAMDQGDEAKTLEFAAKAGELQTVAQGTPKLITSVKRLIADLEDLLLKIDNANSDMDDVREAVDFPSENAINRLLAASRTYDVTNIKSAIADLDKYRYRQYPKLVSGLNQDLMSFRYDLIEDLACELLETHYNG